MPLRPARDIISRGSLIRLVSYRVSSLSLSHFRSPHARKSHRTSRLASSPPLRLCTLPLLAREQIRSPPSTPIVPACVRQGVCIRWRSQRAHRHPCHRGTGAGSRRRRHRQLSVFLWRRHPREVARPLAATWTPHRLRRRRTNPRTSRRTSGRARHRKRHPLGRTRDRRRVACGVTPGGVCCPHKWRRALRRSRRRLAGRCRRRHTGHCQRPRGRHHHLKAVCGAHARCGRPGSSLGVA